MASDAAFEIFLVATPGLEAALCEQTRAAGFDTARQIDGGVIILGDWPDVWRANLVVRGAGRILARIAQLPRDASRPARQARAPGRLGGGTAPATWPFRVEAAAQLRASTTPAPRRSASRRRSARNSVPRSRPRRRCHQGAHRGRPLHHRRRYVRRTTAQARAQRGGRQGADARDDGVAVPRPCGYDGSEPVVDPMCGSGTFVIEAAEIAAGLQPGRSRQFAFEQLATFDAAAWPDPARGVVAGPRPRSASMAATAMPAQSR